MKKLLLFVALLFAVRTLVVAQDQSDLFSLVKIDNPTIALLATDKQALIEKIIKDRFTKQVSFVKIGDLSNAFRDGKLTFNLPGLSTVTMKALKVEILSRTNYKLTAEINTVETFGSVYLLNVEGNVSGFIVLNEKTFHLTAIGNNISLLTERNGQLINQGKMCSGIGALRDNPDTQVQHSGARVEPCIKGDYIRVLVVYTQATLNTLGLQAITDRVNASVEQFNQAYQSSNVTNSRARLQLVGIELTTFNERFRTADADPDNNDRQDVDDLPGFTENRRMQTNADIVVCLVVADYTQSRGIARSINANYGDGFVVVDANFIPDQPVFPHEVGHLLGGRHQNDPASGDAHGYIYTIDFGFLGLGYKTFATIMCPELPQDYRRAIRWSNPNVQDTNQPTGIDGANNVARNISLNTDRIADFRQPSGILNAYVSGNGYVTNYGPQTYEAVVSCGDGPYTFLWDRSYDGFSYFGTATSEFYTFYIYPSSHYYIYLRLRVTSADGQTKTAFFTVNIPNGGGSRVNATDSTMTAHTGDDPKYLVAQGENKNQLLKIVYPNPSNSQFKVLIDLPDAGKTKLSLIDLKGNMVRTIYDGSLLAGQHQFDVSAANISSGVYLVHVSTDKQAESRRLTVVK